MSIQRETIYSALFNQLQAALLAPKGPFVTVSRALMSASQLSTNDQPAAFLVELGEKYENPLYGGPPKITLLAQLYVYAMSDYQSDIPATQVNNLMDAIEDAIAPIPGYGAQTLGNLVFTVWLDGRITDYVTVAEGRQSVSVVQIAMIVPSEQGDQ